LREVSWLKKDLGNTLKSEKKGLAVDKTNGHRIKKLNIGSSPSPEGNEGKGPDYVAGILIGLGLSPGRLETFKVGQ